MRITASLDVKPVTTYYHQLAAAVGQGLEKTIRMEAAATVRKASQLSPVKPLPVSELRTRARESLIGQFGDGNIGGSVNKFTSRRQKKHGAGFAWLVNRSTARVMPMGFAWSSPESIPTPQPNNGQGWRTSDEQWQKWSAQFRMALAKEKQVAAARIGARGLTQKSWFELMLKIANGAPINAPAAIMRARPVKGGSRQIAAAIPVRTPTSFTLSVVNDSGLAIKTGGQRKLNSAISIRRAFFMRSLERGFFSDVKFVSRQYPWAKVSTS